MKRFWDYEPGELVREGSYEAGKVTDMAVHPTRRTVGFLLLKTEGGYTTYTCLVNACAGLSLTRDVPDQVMRRFSETVLGKEPEPVQRPKGVRKYPVLPIPGVPAGAPGGKPERQPETRQPESSMGSKSPDAPYFDFV